MRPVSSLTFPMQARELEVGVRWRDWRQLCGVAFLRLEDFLDNACHQLTLSLVPQGLLFAQVPTDPCLLTPWAPAPSELGRLADCVTPALRSEQRSGNGDPEGGGLQEQIPRPLCKPHGNLEA